MAYIPESQFSRSAKIDDSAIISLAWYFCQGLPMDKAAAAIGVSHKTAREHFLAFRERLIKPQFARWHGMNRGLVGVAEPEQERLIKVTFLDQMAECHGNRKCYQNYRYGMRKERLCRACSLTSKFTDTEKLQEALELVDALHAFYKLLGLRHEKTKDPVKIFTLRLIHTVTVATAQKNSRPIGDNHFDPLDKTFLSLGTLLDVLLEDLAGEPL